MEETRTSPAAFPGHEPEDLDVKESVIFVKADPSVRRSVRDVVREVQCVQWWTAPSDICPRLEAIGGWTDPSGSCGMEPRRLFEASSASQADALYGG